MDYMHACKAGIQDYFSLGGGEGGMTQEPFHGEHIVGDLGVCPLPKETFEN